MYDDDSASASEAGLYLVPTRDGRGKKLVRRPHPPPTATVMADDFDAFTETRGSPTVLAPPGGYGPDGSELELDYDDLTVAPGLLMDVPPSPPRPSASARPPALLSPPRRPAQQQAREREREPPRSLDQLGFGSVALELGRPSPEKAKKPGIAATAGVGAGAGMGSGLRAGGGKGKAPAGRGELVQRRILEDGPERTISMWREDVAASSHAGGSVDESPRELVDRMSARRRAGSASVAREESAPPAVASAGARHRDRLLRKSVDLAAGAPSQSSRSSLNRTLSNASSPPGTQTTALTSPPSGPPHSPRHAAPPSKSPTPNLGARDVKSPVPSAGAAPSLERVLASCDPPLVHLAPVLATLGVRRDEHLRALGRMRGEIRDREVREDALRMGVSVVEWAILIDRLKTL